MRRSREVELIGSGQTQPIRCDSINNRGGNKSSTTDLEIENVPPLDQARLNLQRVVGLPLGSSLTLTEQLRFTEEPPPVIETAVAQANHDRRELQIAEEQNRVTRLERQAVRGEYLPSVELVGDYGVYPLLLRPSHAPRRGPGQRANLQRWVDAGKIDGCRKPPTPNRT